MALASQIPVEVCPNHPEVSAGLIPCARCHKAYCPDCVVELDGKPYDAACKEEQIRDLKSGTAAALDIAGPGRRFGGMFVDGLVIFVPLTVVSLILVARGIIATGPAGLAVRLLGPALVWIAYEVFMLQNFGGQTLGKKVAGLKVVNQDGSDIQPGQAWARAISRELMAITYVVGLVDSLMVFTENRRTLHDRLGKTVVVNWKS